MSTGRASIPHRRPRLIGYLALADISRVHRGDGAVLRRVGAVVVTVRFAQ